MLEEIISENNKQKEKGLLEDFENLSLDQQKALAKKHGYDPEKDGLLRMRRIFAETDGKWDPQYK